MNKNLINIFRFFDELFPHPGCELEYQEDYQLVIAVMLSAQASDVAVNKVTRRLFCKYPSLDLLNDAAIKDLENEIRSLGLYANKARNIKGITSKLINEFQGKVPSSKNSLLSLPGIGGKSANVIRVVLFNIPEIPVDTHVKRVSIRLRLAKEGDSPEVIEKKLHQIIPKDKQILLHHQFIHFGRYFCLARKPNCPHCALKSQCIYYQNNHHDKT